MSKGKHDQVDMLHGPLLGKLILFALPLALSSILQQLFNAVDIAVLGQFATSQDQAAVGCTSAVINMFLNLFLGISVARTSSSRRTSASGIRRRSRPPCIPRC